MRKAGPAKPAPPSIDRFNEAAPELVRKAEGKDVGEHDSRRFNEAAPELVRKGDLTVVDAASGDTLQ